MISTLLIKKICAVLIAMPLLVQAVERQNNGLVLDLNELGEPKAGMLKIEVISDNILHIVAAPEKTFSERPSLIIDKTKWHKSDFSVTEKSDQIILSTEKLSAKISKTNGELGFFDSRGQAIINEPVSGGRVITPAEVMGEQVYNIQQIFESDPDEAFYGLGQHQYNWMNYKGKDLDLYQINIIASVPFVVSSRNYGILWDNYSRTKFGDPAEYQPLSSLILYDREGEKRV